ncbi:MAG: SDR family NAD(P)-dependent oxidoreductase, partial [Patescibacteria group bacterium]
MSSENKVVIVTGAAVGIGRGIALAFGREKKNVVIVDIDEVNLQKLATEVEAVGGKAFPVQCDVSKAQEVKMLYEKTKEVFGRVDILINNAGIYPFKSFLEMQESEWDQVIDVNLKSIFLMCKEAVPFLPEGGRIINISSIASQIAFAGLAHYSASKGGMNALTRGLAVELAPRQITVNAIAPGAIDTPGARISGMDEKEKQAMLSAIPLKRQGTP